MKNIDKVKNMNTDEMFDFAKRHNIKAEFGRDYFELSSVPDDLTKELDKLEIKYKKII